VLVRSPMGLQNEWPWQQAQTGRKEEKRGGEENDSGGQASSIPPAPSMGCAPGGVAALAVLWRSLVMAVLADKP